MSETTFVLVNGVKISSEAIAMLINSFTNPDPAMWYRFERKDDLVVVYCEREPEASRGQP